MIELWLLSLVVVGCWAYRLGARHEAQDWAELYMMCARHDAEAQDRERQA